MPANMAHFFIAEKALRKYREEKGTQDGTGNLLNLYLPFFMLGSIGPDLPNYQKKSMIKKALRGKGVWRPVKIDGFAYDFHSVRPNDMAAALFNVVFKDTQGGQWDARQYSRFAFATGWLCHIVTDRIIHPIVNKFSGNYYASWNNTKIHMGVEVIQDLWCYAHYRGNGYIRPFFDEKPEEWIDIKSERKVEGLRKPEFDKQEIKAFIIYFARAVTEAYAKQCKPRAVKKWLSGINIAMKLMKDIGPIESKAKEFKDLSPEKLKYALSNYANDDFVQNAVPQAEKSCKEMIEYASQYMKRGQPLANEERQNFLAYIGDADLTNPPE